MSRPSLGHSGQSLVRAVRFSSVLFDVLDRLKDDRGGQIIHPHWWLGGRRVFDSCFLITLMLTVALDRYIVVPEDKGNELVCISAFGPTAGERVGIAHPVSTCPSSMAVDDRRCDAFSARSINARCLRNGMSLQRRFRVRAQAEDFCVR